MITQFLDFLALLASANIHLYYKNTIYTIKKKKIVLFIMSYFIDLSFKLNN